MAGNKRIAAIIFFCLTAIGATGSGAYYLLVHSGWTLALKHEDTAGQCAIASGHAGGVRCGRQCMGKALGRANN